MKKIMLILILIILLTACEGSNEVVDVRDDYFDVTKSFPHYIAEIAYYEYNNYYAGMYINEDRKLTICLVEGVPEELIERAEQAGLVVDFVKFSEAELKSILEILTYKMSEYEIRGIGISQKDNNIGIYMTEDAILNNALMQYVEEGIVEVTFTGLVNAW